MDIEDLVGEGDGESQGGGRVYRSPLVFPRAGKAKRQAQKEASRRAKCGPGESPAFLPEGKTVYVRTFGCSHNVSDSEYMCGVLASEGYRVTTEASEAADADAWVVNSCTVKDPSQAAFMKEVRRGLAAEKAVVVAGCIPQGERGLVKRAYGAKRAPELEGASSIGIKQIGRVSEAVGAALRGEQFHALGSGALPALELPKVRKEALVEIVPLSSGCLGSCNYCKTRHARGALGSYAPDEIVARVAGALADGVAEVWLSSEDTGAYGIDLGTSLGALLLRLLPVLEAHPHGMLRVGMTNPPYVLDQLPTLAAALAHDQVYAFLHVPVQSGSDAVLAKEAMNREYTVADFRAVADGLAAAVPGGLSLMTDVICGFPGETEADFMETYALCERYAFGLVNISQSYAGQEKACERGQLQRLPSRSLSTRFA